MTGIESHSLAPYNWSKIEYMDDPMVIEWDDLNALREKAARYEVLEAVTD